MGGIIKRVVALILLIIAFPLLLFISITILIVSGAPFLFVQNRVGYKTNNFKLYKFRTMDKGIVFPFGNLLRKTGLDELPQLWNIFINDMNFVGPRPLTQEDIIRLKWNNPYYMKRWQVKPGITGLSQLSPICHKKATWVMDKFYVQNNSSFLDIKILSLSLIIPLIGKKKAKSLIKSK